MDFITQLQFIQGYNGIIFFVDHFSKYAIFMPTKVPCATEGSCKAIFQECCEVLGSSIEHCVRQGHKVQRTILDRVVQAHLNQTIDEFKLPSIETDG
jgi:hypothetical protein